MLESREGDSVILIDGTVRLVDGEQVTVWRGKDQETHEN